MSGKGNWVVIIEDPAFLRDGYYKPSYDFRFKFDNMDDAEAFALTAKEHSEFTKTEVKMMLLIESEV